MSGSLKHISALKAALEMLGLRRRHSENLLAANWAKIKNLRRAQQDLRARLAANIANMDQSENFALQLKADIAYREFLKSQEALIQKQLGRLAQDRKTICETLSDIISRETMMAQLLSDQMRAQAQAREEEADISRAHSWLMSARYNKSGRA